MQKSSLFRRGINRTFMELKHKSILAYLGGVSVLIEPLWNWNSSTR